MSTVTQSQPVSPSRRYFSHLSPPRAVVNIISSKRHASSADLKQSSDNAPKQRRTASNPLVRVNGNSTSDSDVEENQPSQIVPATVATKHKLTFPHVAKLFVKLRRMQKKAKAHHIDSSSGDDPITHNALLDAGGTETKKLARLELLEVYICSDAVDVAKLLRASRTSLLERSSPLHANTLIDEQWTSSICGPKHRNDGSFRVHIRYVATAATSSKRDPQQPVALDKVSGVSGLMTIVHRDTVSLNVVALYEDAQVIQG